MGALTSLWINNWRLFRLYFFSEERISARSMLLILVVLQLISIGLNVTLSYWSKAVMNAFQSYEKSKFHRLLLYFCFLALAIISVSVFKAYLAQTFRLDWRRWLTDHFLTLKSRMSSPEDIAISSIKHVIQIHIEDPVFF